VVLIILESYLIDVAGGTWVSKAGPNLLKEKIVGFREGGGFVKLFSCSAFSLFVPVLSLDT
jgi:hypothetical protein